MFSILTIVVISLSILLGGAGATVYAAQDSLPNEALYQVKVMTENVWSGVERDPMEQVTWELKLSDRRLDEIVGLVEKGESVPSEVITRYKDQLETVIVLASGMSEASDQVEAFEKVGLHIRDQDRLMSLIQLRDGAGGGIIAEVRAMLREQIRRMANGVDVPRQLRQQFQLQGVISPTLTISGTFGISGTHGISNSYGFSGTHGISNAYGISGTFGISNSYNFSGTQGISNSFGTQYGPGPDAGHGPAPEVTPGLDAGSGPGPDAGSGTDAGANPDSGQSPDNAPAVTPDSGGEGSGSGAGTGGNTSPGGTEPPSDPGGAGKP